MSGWRGVVGAWWARLWAAPVPNAPGCVTLYDAPAGTVTVYDHPTGTATLYDARAGTVDLFDQACTG